MNRRGLLMLNGWEGYTETEIEVIRETPKRYEIRAITKTKVAGRNRWLNAGEKYLIPKNAIKLIGGK